MSDNELYEVRQKVRGRFWVEAMLAAVSAVLLVVTLMWQDWIELVAGVRPDHGDGSLEWLLVTGLLLAASVSSVVARLEWRRTRLARPQVGNS